MTKSKLTTAIIVPVLALGTFKLCTIAESALDSIKVPTVGEVAVVALAAASGTQNVEEIVVDGEPLPPIAAGPQSIPAPVPATNPTAADVKAEVGKGTELAKAAIPFQNTDAMSASEQGILQSALLGNGRERMVVTLRNNSPTPLRVNIPAGQIMESGRNVVIAVRSAEAEVMPAQSVELRLTTVALFSANKVSDSAFKFSYQTAPKLEGFLAWVAKHPEVSVPALQTAALALSENLPLNALSKFAPTNGITSKLATDAFRAETGDIIAALAALRDSGVKLATVALSQDPQLRIEAMIEPLSREVAKRYYGITEEREWDFWKTQLLNGDPGTRHYALFGIARFYPQVAIEMLPKWARESKTHPIYRMSAVQALADTQRPEALPILHGLATELGSTTELGKAATQAAQYLDTRLSQNASAVQNIAFRGKKSVSGQ